MSMKLCVMLPFFSSGIEVPLGMGHIRFIFEQQATGTVAGT